MIKNDPAFPSTAFKFIILLYKIHTLHAGSVSAIRFSLHLFFARFMVILRWDRPKDRYFNLWPKGRVCRVVCYSYFLDKEKKTESLPHRSHYEGNQNISKKWGVARARANAYTTTDSLNKRRQRTRMEIWWSSKAKQQRKREWEDCSHLFCILTIIDGEMHKEWLNIWKREAGTHIVRRVDHVEALYKTIFSSQWHAGIVVRRGSKCVRCLYA